MKYYNKNGVEFNSFLKSIFSKKERPIEIERKEVKHEVEDKEKSEVIYEVKSIKVDHVDFNNTIDKYIALFLTYFYPIFEGRKHLEVARLIMSVGEQTTSREAYLLTNSTVRLFNSVSNSVLRMLLKEKEIPYVKSMIELHAYLLSISLNRNISKDTDPSEIIEYTMIGVNKFVDHSKIPNAIVGMEYESDEENVSKDKIKLVILSWVITLHTMVTLSKYYSNEYIVRYLDNYMSSLARSLYIGDGALERICNDTKVEFIHNDVLNVDLTEDDRKCHVSKILDYITTDSVEKSTEDKPENSNEDLSGDWDGDIAPNEDKYHYVEEANDLISKTTENITKEIMESDEEEFEHPWLVDPKKGKVEEKEVEYKEEDYGKGSIDHGKLDADVSIKVNNDNRELVYSENNNVQFVGTMNSDLLNPNEEIEKAGAEISNKDVKAYNGSISKAVSAVLNMNEGVKKSSSADIFKKMDPNDKSKEFRTDVSKVFSNIGSAISKEASNMSLEDIKNGTFVANAISAVASQIGENVDNLKTETGYEESKEKEKYTYNDEPVSEEEYEEIDEMTGGNITDEDIQSSDNSPVDEWGIPG